ncbi:MAG TPA: signal peptidase I [Nevskiaceae bacterium]|nr:signal peptidase I [Nevskiaceae bacterium]
MKAWLHENRVLIGLLLTFGLVRGAIAGYNPVPSGSMHPSLLEGDVVLVNHLAYDAKLPFTHLALARLGEPERGEIVVFDSPDDGKLLIKRLVGLPGDTIEMRDKRLFINGIPARYETIGAVIDSTAGHDRAATEMRETFGDSSRVIRWLPIRHDADDFGPITIPADHYLMLGDNRDNSRDSRYIGLVPRRLLVGRAERVLISADIEGNWLPRFGRFGQRLN